MIARAARRGADLTQRLLAFARKQALDPRVIYVHQLVSAMDDLLRRTLGEHIDIHVEGGEGLWPALVDPGQLESALLNLAINARDAMPGGGHLTIKSANVWLEEAEAKRLGDVLPGPYVQLSVCDTGVGIHPEHLDRVFEPFFTTKETGKGTGLGLAMVYGFIKQSGGHVQIESQPGYGTAVNLYLPPVDGMQRSFRPAEREASVESGSEAILLVEDDDLVRQCVSDQLVLLGYHVIEARNGPEALSVLRTGTQVDLLFTDIVMPGGMTGRQLAEDARQLRPGLQVLFTSGYTEDTFGNHGRLGPGVQLLSKPYRQSDLAQAIRKALTARA
jgi:CheY-like chemotaxis protein